MMKLQEITRSTSCIFDDERNYGKAIESVTWNYQRQRCSLEDEPIRPRTGEMEDQRSALQTLSTKFVLLE